MKPNHKTRAEILSRISVDKETKCWNWIGSQRGKGYGAIVIGQKALRAHRVAFEIFKGSIPDGIQVLHRCDNRKCVNPDHLFLGTNLDNVLDSRKKGRSNHRLTDDQVRLIRDTPKSSQAKLTAIGISRSGISRIRSGQYYAHVH